MAQRDEWGGPVTDDGCPVLVYADLPDAGESELVARWCPAGGSVLDLGAGTGRIADPLAQRGFRVVAVDSSADMLAHVRHARTQRARIESLRLDERFDLVLLASHLVNTPDEQTRLALLATAAHHRKAGARVLLQWHPPAWFDSLDPGERIEGTLGRYDVVLTVHDLAAGLMDATVSYAADGSMWSQHFTARRITHSDLATTLARCGLTDFEVVSDDGTWICAQ